MADQTVRIEDSSRERVALDLMKFITQNAGDAKTETSTEILDLFTKCRSAAYGAKH